MEYTKDMIFNIKYDDNSQVIRLKKENCFRRMLMRVCENKFILTILGLTTLLIAIDTVFVTTFIKILSTLV